MLPPPPRCCLHPTPHRIHPRTPPLGDNLQKIKDQLDKIRGLTDFDQIKAARDQLEAAVTLAIDAVAVSTHNALGVGGALGGCPTARGTGGHGLTALCATAGTSLARPQGRSAGERRRERPSDAWRTYKALIRAAGPQAGPFAVIALIALGLGLAAAITSTVAGALYAAGSAVGLAAAIIVAEVDQAAICGVDGNPPPAATRTSSNNDNKDDNKDDNKRDQSNKDKQLKWVPGSMQRAQLARGAPERVPMCARRFKTRRRRGNAVARCIAWMAACLPAAACLPVHCLLCAPGVCVCSHPPLLLQPVSGGVRKRPPPISWLGTHPRRPAV